MKVFIAVYQQTLAVVNALVTVAVLVGGRQWYTSGRQVRVKLRQCSDLLAQFGILDYIGLDLGSLGGGLVIRDLLQSWKMGVGISKQSDSIRSSVIKGGELISKSEVDRKSIGEQEPIENPDASELASPFNEATFYQNQGVGQIKEESKPQSPQPDPVEETQNLDEKIGNIRKKGEEVEEPEYTPRASEVELWNQKV